MPSRKMISLVRELSEETTFFSFCLVWKLPGCFFLSYNMNCHAVRVTKVFPKGSLDMIEFVKNVKILKDTKNN